MKESFLSFSSILLINPLKYSILSIILSKRFSFWRFIYPVIKNSLEYSINEYEFSTNSSVYSTSDKLHIFFISKHSKKCTFYTLRFGCSFAAVNTIKPQLL